MSGSELTRDQLEELDSITKVYSDEYVSQMSRFEQKNYRELLTARDEVEAYMRSQNAPGQPTRTNTAVMEPPVVDTASIPALKEAPASKPVEQVQVPEPTETGIPADTVDHSDTAQWEEKLRVMTERYKNAQAELSPAQQKAATLRKALSASEQAQEDLKERMERIEQALLNLKTAPAPAPAPTPTVDPFAGLEEVDPDLNQRLRAFKDSVAQENEAKIRALQQRIDDQERRAKASEQANQEAAFKAFVAEHDAKVAAMVPEFQTLVKTQEGWSALTKWLEKQPPALGRIITNPYSNTPHDVAFVLNQFKAQHKATNGAKKPSLGDLAAPVKLAPATPLNETSQALDIFSDEEMNNLDAMQHAIVRKGGDMEAFIEKAERTLAHKEKLSQRR